MYAIRVNKNTTNQVQSRTQPVRSDSDLVGFFVGDILMKHIPLTQGKFAIVDDEDYEYLTQWKWIVKMNSGIAYAGRWITCVTNGTKRRTAILMHRVIMNTPPGKQTDHVNHNELDNRKYNLRICSAQQNQFNSRSQKNSFSQYKGVSRNRGKWRAQIRHNNKDIWLGVHASAVAAAKAYDKKAKQLFGEFAYLNFRDGDI